MGDPADRYGRVAGTFTARVQEVPPDAWDLPAPAFSGRRP